MFNLLLKISSGNKKVNTITFMNRPQAGSFQERAAFVRARLWGLKHINLKTKAPWTTGRLREKLPGWCCDIAQSRH